MQARNKQRDPVFMLVSKEAMPPKGSLLSAGGALVTLAGTAFTALAYGIGNFALRPEFYQRVRELVVACYASGSQGGRAWSGVGQVSVR